MINLKVLPALQGDCFILTFGEEKEEYCIIIDSGMGKVCFRKLKSFIEEKIVNNKRIGMMILTHYDQDHISGFIDLFRTNSVPSNVIEEVWFNFGNDLSKQLQADRVFNPLITSITTKTSVKQGMKLHKLLTDSNIDINAYIKEYDVYEYGGAQITVLSPSVEQLKTLIESSPLEIEYDKISPNTAVTENDYYLSIEEAALIKPDESIVTIANKSSIAFVFEYEGKRLLFLGDAVSSQIITALLNLGYSKDNPLRVDYCKVSHHGSTHNTTVELIKMLECSNYIISSNWKRGRPTKSCLSKIILNSKNSVNLFYNYSPRNIFSEDEIDRYDIRSYIISEEGISL